MGATKKASAASSSKNARARLQEQTTSINEALLISGLRQHELTEAAEKLNVQLQTEIAERKKTDAALHEAEERWRLALDGAELGAWNLNLETSRLVTDAWLQTIFGCGAELDYAEVMALIHPDDMARVQAAIAASTRPVEPSPYAIEYRVVHPDGAVRWIFAQGRANFGLVDGKRKSLSFDGTIADITERKQVAEDLRSSEERYRTLFNSMDEGFCIIEMIYGKNKKVVDYRFLEINPAFEKQTGLTDVIGKRMRELFPKHEQFWFDIYGKVALTGAAIRFENYAAQLNRWCDVNAFLVEVPEGRRVGIVFNDITERKESEEVQARLGAIVSSADDGILSKSMDGVVTTWNASAERLFGYTAEEIIGHPTLHLTPPDLLHEEAYILQQIRAGKPIENLETQRLTKDGHRLLVSLTISPIKDATGKVIGASKIVRDITERKQAEEASARLAAIVRSSNDAIIGTDDHGIIISWNRAATRLFGYKAQEAIGQPVTMLIPPARKHEEAYIMERIIQGEFVPQFETVRRRKNGKLLDVSLTISPIADAEGRVVGASKIVRDITERKKAEVAHRRAEVLAASNKKLEKEIVQRTAVEKALTKSEQHQVRLLEQSYEMQTQLRHLSHQLLQAQEEERKRISRELHDVVAQALVGITLHLTPLTMEATVRTNKALVKKIALTQKLVDDSLAIVHRFVQDLRPTGIDDMGLAHALHSYLKHFMRQTGIRASLSTFAGVEKFSNAIRMVLYRIAQEALTNVARHAQASRVTVRIHPHRGAVRMEIHDDGQGFQVDGATWAKGRKHLGLLGMRERVEMIGGTFSVESAPGKETTIKVEIPQRSAKKRAVKK